MALVDTVLHVNIVPGDEIHVGNRCSRRQHGCTILCDDYSTANESYQNKSLVDWYLEEGVLILGPIEVQSLLLGTTMGIYSMDDVPYPLVTCEHQTDPTGKGPFCLT